jgi:hypothetical protein
MVRPSCFVLKVRESARSLIARTLSFALSLPCPIKQGREELLTAAVERGLSNSLCLLKGVAEAALYCAYRPIYMLPPGLLVMSQGMGAD